MILLPACLQLPSYVELCSATVVFLRNISGNTLYICCICVCVLESSIEMLD